MNKDEAYNTILQICRNYRGTMDEHKIIGDALQIVYDILNKEEKKE